MAATKAWEKATNRRRNIGSIVLVVARPARVRERAERLEHFAEVDRPAAVLDRELEVFATHPLFFWARALGLAGIWILAPLLIRRGEARSQDTNTQEATRKDHHTTQELARPSGIDSL